MTITFAQKAILNVCVDASEPIHEGLVGIIGVFTGIKEHAILVANFIADVGLSFIRALIHLVLADRASDIPQVIVESTHFRITIVDILRAPFLLQCFGLTVVKPQSAAVGTAINDYSPCQGTYRYLQHFCATFWTIHCFIYLDFTQLHTSELTSGEHITNYRVVDNGIGQPCAFVQCHEYRQETVVD